MNLTGHQGPVHFTDGPAYSDSELAYDVCSKTWNDREWYLRGNPKVAFAGVKEVGGGSASRCFSAASSLEGEFTIKALEELKERIRGNCLKEFTKCYVFAVGNELSKWVGEEQERLADGSRFRSTNHAVTKKPARTTRESDDDDDDDSEAAQALVKGVIQGLSNAVRNSGGGGSGGGGRLSQP